MSRPVNFGELVERAAALDPARIAIVQEGDELTYGELAQRIRRVSGLLRSRGIRQGEPVLLALPNDRRVPEALLGTIHAGAVATPLNIKFGDETLAYVAEHSEARLVITHSDLLERVAGLGVETLLTVDDPAWPDAEPATAPAAVEPADPAMLMYTSGSTGRPKGVLRAHASEWWQSRTIATCFMLDEDDRGLVTGPLYHANALWTILLPMLLTGGSASIMRSWTADGMLAAIERDRPTFTAGTPAMFTLMLRAWDDAPDYRLDSLNLVVCGSAPVPASLLEELKRRLGGVDVVEGYGLTEGGANILTPRWGVQKLGSAGLPVPGVELRVVDPESARECATGETGELWTRSPSNLVGYLKQPDLAAERLSPDGWLRTGDLVRRDEDGYVSLVGRVDDMINVGGENVYPKEVESVLLEHPSVADVCVVAAPHPIKGSAPVAWIVAQAPPPTEEELKQYFLARGPAYAHPRRVFFVDRLPLTGTNKLDRKQLELDAARLVAEAVAP
jgi:acyl-CoA synthetase (AMP-forming)/AMP-acid ligase II